LGGGNSGYALYVEQMTQESGFAGKISFIGERTDDYYDWLNLANGVVITSSKESFSLVAVEAAYLGKPVVSFANGGISEIIREGMGVVVNSWNDTDLIQAMVRVMNGEISFDRSIAENRTREFSIEKQGPGWLNLLTKYFGG
jgi:glycosyltransferase involved in cell wall biosynthesis